MNRVLAMTGRMPRSRQGAVPVKSRGSGDPNADSVRPPRPLWTWLRRIGPWALLLLLVLAAQMLWHWLKAPTTLPIRTVAVTGELTHVTPTQVRRVIGAHLDAGFFGLDLPTIAAALDALPWVAQADVRRVWPNGLAVSIRQQHATARWDGNELLNRSGTVFRPPRATFPKGLPDLSGPPGKELDLMKRYATADRLFQSVHLRVVALNENARRAYQLRLNNGIEVIIGRHWSQQRLARMVAVYRRVLIPRAADIARIDLRYTNGFAVAWKSSAAQAAAAPGRH